MRYFQQISEDGTKIHEETVGNLQECAQLSVNTDGGTFWTFDLKNKVCAVHNMTKNNTNFVTMNGMISGEKECGLMTQEEWDEKMIAECVVQYGRSSNAPTNWEIKGKSLQVCAVETAKRNGPRGGPD